MRQRKLGVLLLLVVVMVCGMLLTACGKHTKPSSVEDFMSIASKHTMTIIDQSSKIGQGSKIKSLHLATKGEEKDTRIQLEFYLMESKDACKDTYDEVTNQFKASYSKKSGYEESHSEEGSYASTIISTDTKYYKVARIGDTLVVGISPVQGGKTELETLFDELGY